MPHRHYVGEILQQLLGQVDARPSPLCIQACKCPVSSLCEPVFRRLFSSPSSLRAPAGGFFDGATRSLDNKPKSGAAFTCPFQSRLLICLQCILYKAVGRRSTSADAHLSSHVALSVSSVVCLAPGLRCDLFHLWPVVSPLAHSTKKGPHWNQAVPANKWSRIQEA